MSHTPTYKSWDCMWQRCENPKDLSYPRYGARGIRVCERWALFANFVADMGVRPAGMTLDRIDNEKGYEPGNCRWATDSDQSRNRSSTRHVDAFGETKPVVAWAQDERCVVSVYVLTWRLNKGWSVERAVTEPPRPKLPNGARAAHRAARRQGVPA